MKYRQEVINVVLAQLMQERGLVAAPEQIINFGSSKDRSMPDVLLDFQGLRLAIEGEYGITLISKKKAGSSALRRVNDGIANIGIAILYPNELKSVDFSILKSTLSECNFHYSIITETKKNGNEQLPLFPTERAEVSIHYTLGNIDELSESLRRLYDELIRDQVLEDSVDLLEKSIDGFNYAITNQPATTERFAVALGIKSVPTRRKAF
jgi:hypothetical protein